MVVCADLHAASGLPLELNTLNGDRQSFGEADAINFFADENAVLSCVNNFGSSRHNSVSGSGGVGTAGNVNMFANPQAVFNCARDPILGLDGGAGGAGVLRGMPFWNVDFQVKKNIRINERFSAEFQSIFTNVFNHDQLLDPFLSLASPPVWGVENTQGKHAAVDRTGHSFPFLTFPAVSSNQPQKRGRPVGLPRFLFLLRFQAFPLLALLALLALPRRSKRRDYVHEQMAIQNGIFLRQILAQPLHHGFRFRHRRIVQVLSKKHEVPLPPVLNVARLDEAVIFARIRDVFHRHMPFI